MSPAARRRRVRLPRTISAGAVPAQHPGERLTCVVLAAGDDEWIGVDCATGAFLRVPGALELDATPPGLPHLAVEFPIGLDEEPPDLARPESVRAGAAPVRVPTPHRRALRRLLRNLAVPERRGATILGTRGPSIAYVDLDGNAPSLALIAANVRTMELAARTGEEAACDIRFAGTTQRLVLSDDRARRAALASSPRPLRGQAIAAALGYRPTFALVGLGPVENGHAKKLVLALL